MKRAGTRPRGWHLRRAGRPYRTSYGGVIALVAMCEISVFCVLGRRIMPLWVLVTMIAVPVLAGVLAWTCSAFGEGRGRGER